MISLTAGSNVETTINGGTGNDTIHGKIYSYSKILFDYASGDGDDVIHEFNASDTLRVVGNYQKSTAGNDVVVTYTGGSVTLKDAATLSTINIDAKASPLLVTGSDGDDTIKNTLSGATIQALAGNDSIENIYDSVSIDAGAGGGNDTIENESGTTTIFAGNGNDSVYNYSQFVTVDLGNGNDTIKNKGGYVSINASSGSNFINNGDDYKGGSNVTIKTGYAADTIVNSGDFAKIFAGDGDDSIDNSGERVTVDAGPGTTL